MYCQANLSRVHSSPRYFTSLAFLLSLQSHQTYWYPQQSTFSKHGSESSVDFLGIPFTAGLGPLERLANKQQSFDMEEDRLGALDASRKRKNSDSLPLAKKPKTGGPIDLESRQESTVATQPPATPLLLDDLYLRRRAIDALDISTLQQLLFDATKKSITLEIRFAEKQRDEQANSNDFSHVLDSVVDLISSNYQHLNDHSSLYSDIVAKGIEDLLERIEEQVTVASSYATKRAGLKILCEIGNWILSIGHCALGRGVQQHFEAHDAMAEAMLCVTDMLVDQEMWKMRADKEVQVSIKTMRSRPMLCVHEALTFVTETGHCSCPDCVSA
ncbi:hypothetical protein LTR17_011636 [Elasticomyces elasticus]|nr:hypothetical protein LTR17_011636 [Elasticomyces elasticus]